MIGKSLAEYGNFEIRRFQKDNGIFAEKIGTVKQSEKSWHIATYIDLENFYKNYRITKKLFEEYMEYSRSFGSREWLGQEENIIIERKIIEIQSQTEEILTMLDNKIRDKRSIGLLKYVGKAGKYLFGILNEDDENYFNDKISKLDSSDNEILSLMDNQTQIIKSKFLICDENFSYYDKKLTENEILISNETLQSRKIWFYMTVISRYITDLEIDASTIIDAIIFSNEGQLHPRLISHNNVQKIIKIIKLAESNYDLPFSETPTLAEISKLSHITIYYNDDKIKYIIDIPLLDKDTFNLFKNYPLPYQLNNSNLFIFILPNKQFTAINADQDKFINFEENELKNCLKNEKRFFCETQPITTIDENSPCEVKIVLHKKLNMEKFCDIRIKAFKQILFQKLSKPNTWLFSTPNETQINIICKNNVFNEILYNSGIIKIDPHCKAKTRSVLLKTTKIREFSQTTNLSELFPIINIFSQNEIELLKPNIAEVIEHKPLKYDNRNLEKSDDLYEISQKIKYFKAKNRLDLIENNQSLIYIYAIIICTTLLIILISYASVKIFIFKKGLLNSFDKKFNTEKHNTARELTDNDLHLPSTTGIMTQTEITCSSRPIKAEEREK